MQGNSAPIRLRHGARGLTDGAGLVLVRRLWDQLKLGAWIDVRAAEVAGVFRSSLMVEFWVTLLLYRGTVLDDLTWFRNRGIRRPFGWVRVPDPTTFGRWLRRAAERLVPVLDELVWHLVRVRWSQVGVQERVTVVLDSTVSVRYGTKQAGAEKGYNPKKPGRPSDHPLVANVAETGDLIGVRWRPGSASASEGATDWLELQEKPPSSRSGDIQFYAPEFLTGAAKAGPLRVGFPDPERVREADQTAGDGSESHEGPRNVGASLRRRQQDQDPAVIAHA